VSAFIQRRLGQHSEQRCLAHLRQADDSSFHEFFSLIEGNIVWSAACYRYKRLSHDRQCAANRRGVTPRRRIPPPQDETPIHASSKTIPGG
jgi:hypothetical protein